MDDEVERAGRRFEVVKPAAFYRSEPGEIRRQLPRPSGSAIGDADQSRTGFQQGNLREQRGFERLCASSF